jgi:hypothetical protein
MTTFRQKLKFLFDIINHYVLKPQAWKKKHTSHDAHN